MLIRNTGLEHKMKPKFDFTLQEIGIDALCQVTRRSTGVFFQMLKHMDMDNDVRISSLNKEEVLENIGATALTSLKALERYLQELVDLGCLYKASVDIYEVSPLVVYRAETGELTIRREGLDMLLPSCGKQAKLFFELVKCMRCTNRADLSKVPKSKLLQAIGVSETAQRSVIYDRLAPLIDKGVIVRVGFMEYMVEPDIICREGDLKQVKFNRVEFYKYRKAVKKSKSVAVEKSEGPVESKINKLLCRPW